MNKKPSIYNRSFETIKTILCDNSYGLYPAPMKSQEALEILTSYLLGEDWHIVDSIGPEQCNTIVVWEILNKYSKQWKRDFKNYKKGA